MTASRTYRVAVLVRNNRTRSDCVLSRNIKADSWREARRIAVERFRTRDEVPVYTVLVDQITAHGVVPCFSHVFNTPAGTA